MDINKIEEKEEIPITWDLILEQVGKKRISKKPIRTYFTSLREQVTKYTKNKRNRIWPHG